MEFTTFRKAPKPCAALQPHEGGSDLCRSRPFRYAALIPSYLHPSSPVRQPAQPSGPCAPARDGRLRSPRAALFPLEALRFRLRPPPASRFADGRRVRSSRAGAPIRFIRIPRCPGAPPLRRRPRRTFPDALKRPRTSPSTGRVSEFPAAQFLPSEAHPGPFSPGRSFPSELSSPPHPFSAIPRSGASRFHFTRRPLRAAFRSIPSIRITASV